MELKRNARRQMRMLLGRWGQWRTRFERLQEELATARDWMDELAAAHRAELEPKRRRLLRKRLRLAAELERSIDREIAGLTRLRAHISALVGELPVGQQEVVERRYVRGEGWLQIAAGMNYDESSARRLEACALDALAERVRFGSEISPCQIPPSGV